MVNAAVAESHGQPVASLELVSVAQSPAGAAHSCVETCSTLTGLGVNGLFQFAATEAIAALGGVRAKAVLLALTPGEYWDALRRFADAGGIGPRLHDALIGEVARAHGIASLMIWHTRHMAGLFPDLQVSTPAQYLRRA